MPDQIDLLIGQMFIFGFSGLDVDAESGFAERYRGCPVGGVILFGRNCRAPEQVRRLTERLQELAAAYRPDQPLLIAVDQEGGNLSPLRGLVTSLPGNMGLAATGDPAAAYYAGYTTGCDLRSLGINVNLAPVLDLALEPRNPVIGTRAFSDSPREAAALGTEFARGLAAAGALFTAKHFPGHGSCLADSHVCLPVCGETRAALWNRDLRPFREVASIEGCSVMVAHVKYDGEGLDPDNPASLSPRVIGGLLREEIGFDGVVITDCLEMAAVSAFCPIPEAAVRAVQAGADIVLISHTPAAQEAGYQALRQAVSSGVIGLPRIRCSVERINRWKLGIRARIGTRSGSGLEGMAPTLRAAAGWTPASLADRVITFAGDRGCPWAFNREPLGLVTPDSKPTTPAENPVAGLEALEKALAKRSIPSFGLTCSIDPGEAEIADTATRIRNRGLSRVAVIPRNPFDHPGQSRLVKRLREEVDVLLISTRDPREVLAFRPSLPAVFTYSCETMVMEALARVLCGESEPIGRLPVSLAAAAL